MDRFVKIDLPEEQAKPLVLAATGCPYFLLVRQEGVGIHYTMTEGFDTDWLFDIIKLLARQDADFKALLTDYVIDLSKEV